MKNTAFLAMAIACLLKDESKIKHEEKSRHLSNKTSYSGNKKPLANGEVKTLYVGGRLFMSYIYIKYISFIELLNKDYFFTKLNN